MKTLLVKSVVLAFSLALILAACNLPATPTSTFPITEHPFTPTFLPTPIPPSPTVTVEPSATPFPSPTLVAVGPAEMVYDWSKDKCESLDIPDLPTRAFRDAQGNVVMISAHITGRRFVGPNLNEVKHQCPPIMNSDFNRDPSKFDDNEWLASPYTEDGQTVYAVVHMEYHGWEHGLTCPGVNFSCWYNALTFAVSNDGGASFHDSPTPPDNLIASLPHPYEAGAGPYGIMEPSNIIKKDGNYYFFARIDEYKSDDQRICLFRTNDLSDPKSWRAWGGMDFDSQYFDPYQQPDQARSAKPCAPIDINNLGIMASNITFNTYLNKYVMVGTTATQQNGREVWGILYAFSDDLIHWEHRQMLLEVPLPWNFKVGEPNVYLYPSLLDPNSESLNFETSGKTAYLYLTRFNHYTVGNPLDRDLIRIPVEFFPTAAEANQAKVDFVP